LRQILRARRRRLQPRLIGAGGRKRDDLEAPSNGLEEVRAMKRAVLVVLCLLALGTLTSCVYTYAVYPEARFDHSNTN
jgi:hypothetical protein